MKKLLVLLTALSLPCFLVHAQEAEETGRGAGLEIIPRFDAGAVTYPGSGEKYLSFGNTSLYALCEGNFTENLSFSVMGHFIASDAWADGSVFKDAFGTPTADLYKFLPVLGGADKNYNNFLDWAYLSYGIGDFTVSAGKMALFCGGFEFDDYDYDVNPLSASIFWNSFLMYRHGVSVSWTAPSESTTLALQVTSDPYNCKPAYAGQWNGEYGAFSTIWSLTAFRNNFGPGKWNLLASLGNRLVLGDTRLTATYLNRCGDPLYTAPCVKGHTVTADATQSLGESIELGLKYCFNRAKDDNPYGNGMTADESIHGAGLCASWFPIEDLRLQCNAGFNGDLRYALVGITWHFKAKLW